MIEVNYQKRKNVEIFKSLEEPELLFLSNAQNYIPIYTKFFSLNETNYNSINLNHKWYISSIHKSSEDDNSNYNLYNCRVKNIVNNKTKDKNVFFKMAPLLDPYKYLIGKYNILDEKLYNLPKFDSTEETCHPKFIDINNSAYVDGMFLYLTSSLLNTHNFSHGVDYYGSFLGIKNDFIINVFDDIDYLNNSDFFNKNKNVLFKIDDYEHLFQDENQKLKPIIIQHNSSAKSQLSIKSFDNEIFEEVFEDINEENKDNKDNKEVIDLDDLVDLSNTNILDNKESNQNVTLKSSSTCSSRSSYTNDEYNGEEDDENLENDIDYDIENTSEVEDESKSNSENDDSESFEEERIEAIIPKFPVQIIGMEYCENTFDDLILNEELTTDEWYSAFMQIIMILITYQKAFNFTHNDLHTNNVMYNKTDKKFIYYCYKKNITRFLHLDVYIKLLILVELFISSMVNCFAVIVFN